MSAGPIKALSQLPAVGGALAPAAPPLEAEPPHKKLARLNREQERLVEALQELKRDWAQKNIKAQACRTPIATSEITFVEKKRRELAGQLLAVQTQIASANKAIRERKAGGGAGAKNGAQALSAKAGTRHKECPLKAHRAFDQYFRLAAENELQAGLYARIEAAAKSLLSHALRTGIEEP